MQSTNRGTEERGKWKNQEIQIVEIEDKAIEAGNSCNGDGGDQRMEMEMVNAEHKEMSQQTDQQKEEGLTQLETTTNVNDINIPKVETSTSPTDANHTSSSKSRENFSTKPQ